MKKALLATAVFAIATAPAFAQTTSAKPVSSTDQTFMMNTAKAGMAEVELGKLALQNASSDAVKKFGQKMVEDHSKKNDELKALAASKNVVLPSEVDAQDKAMHDKMAAMTGEAFDREYMTMMVAGHRKVVESFRAEAAAGQDADLKAWVTKTLPGVEEHLKLAQDTNRAVGTSGVKK
jgi:putative membrane protein